MLGSFNHPPPPSLEAQLFGAGVAIILLLILSRTRSALLGCLGGMIGCAAIATKVFWTSGHAEGNEGPIFGILFGLVGAVLGLFAGIIGKVVFRRRSSRTD